MSARAEKIAAIIDQRKPIAEKIQQAEKNLQKLFNNLASFQDILSVLSNKVDEEFSQELGKIFSLISDTQAKIKGQDGIFNILMRRFTRETINIGVVGRARQGKSRLLQSMSGLSNNEIPDGKSGHCTGTRSRLIHSGGAVKATIFFHNEQTLLHEIIAPYFQVLKLGNFPISLKSFINNPLPQMEAEDNAENNTKYDHLKKYHENYSKFEKFLNNHEPLSVDQTRVREFVAQDDESGKIQYFNYLAVKEAVIYCPFPNEDVGKVSLIDMPGLGDTGHGDEERLISALGQETDFVLFVKMPVSTGDYWADVDVKLYDVANRSLMGSLSIDQWSFQVLNHKKIVDEIKQTLIEDNLDNCKRLAGEISKKHINVAETIICDCSDKKDVQANLLDRVLDYLTANITTLDEKFALSRQASLMEIGNNCRQIVKSTKDALISIPLNSRSHELLLDKFNSLYDRLAIEIRKFVKETRQIKDHVNSEYDAGLKEILTSIESNHLYPDSESLETLESRLGSYSEAYLAALHTTRAAISKEFLRMDRYLEKAVENVKNKIAKILLEECGFKAAFKSENLEFLEEFHDFLLKTPRLKDLALAIKMVLDFRLSYREFLHPKVRKSLDTIDPNGSDYMECGYNPKLSDVNDALEMAYMKVTGKLRASLEQFSSEVNMALFALAEEFEDRTLRASDIKNQWSIVCDLFKSDLWSEEFGQLEANSIMREEIEKSLGQIFDSANNLSLVIA
ncbi:MAG: hypothetical protein AB1403_04220 [Candidatus Riflebacteria bacterium]